MANTKISSLSAGAPAVSTDLTVIARGGSNYNLTLANILRCRFLCPVCQTDCRISIPQCNRKPTVATTKYYVTSSNINLPATLKTGIVVGTTINWRVCFTKNAAWNRHFLADYFHGNEWHYI